MMNFIVIEKFDFVAICTNEDGETMYFETREDAQKHADEECQNGQVVELF